jgi:hypothetical protein
LFKFITTISLIIAFAAQSFRGAFVMLDYYTDTAAFAKSCINRAKPALHCNGKCQMMKQMQEEEKKDQQVPERKFKNEIEVFSSQSFFNSSATTISVIITKAISIETNYPLKDISFAFFHPPQG